jgi:spermidine/putrescine transport system permease protein
VKKFDLWLHFASKIGLWVVTIWGFIFLYLPIVILIIYSFNASRFNAVWRGFTWQWYHNLWSGISDGKANITDVMIWNALGNSLIVAFVSTIVATILGTMLALALEKYKFKGRNLTESLVIAPIIIPDLTMGISLLAFFSLAFQILENITGFRLVLGLTTVIISHIIFNISFVTVTVRNRIAELDPVVDEAAADLGATDWDILRYITLPLITPAIISGALLAFTLSLDDFVVTFFTTGVGGTTLPLYVYGMIKFSVTPAINAISTLMFLASLLLVGCSVLVQKKFSR